MNKTELLEFLNKKADEAWNKADVVKFQISNNLADELESSFNNLTKDEKIEIIRDLSQSDLGLDWKYTNHFGILTIGFIEEINNAFCFMGISWEDIV